MQHLIVNFLTASTYELTLIANGCSGLDTIVKPIDVFMTPILNGLQDITVCPNVEVELNASGNNLSNFIWEPSENLININSGTPTANISETTIFTVTGISDQGCASATESFTAEVINFPDYRSDVIANNTCPNEPIKLEAISMGGDLTFSWSGTNLPPTPGAIQSVVPLNDTASYVLTISFANCQIQVESPPIILESLPVATIADNVDPNIVCIGDPINLVVESTEVETYAWFPPDYVSDIRGPNINWLATEIGVNTVSVEITGFNGCVDTLRYEAETNVYPETQFSNSAPSVCNGDTALVLLSDIVLESGFVIYTVTPNESAEIRQDSLFLFPAQDTEYAITANFNACLSDTTFQATVSADGLDLQVNQSDILCGLDTIMLTPAGADNFIWEMNPSIIFAEANGVITIAPTSNTVYTVTGTNASGCEGSLPYTVEIFEPISYQLIEDLEICNTEEISLLMDFSGDFTDATFDWNSPDVNQNDTLNPLVSPTMSSTYSVLVTDQNGCTTMDEVNINFSSETDFMVAVTDTILCADASTMLTIPAGFTDVNIDAPQTDVEIISETDYLLTPANVISGEIIYTITGLDEMGCSVGDSFTINFLPNEAVNILTNNNNICIGDSITLTIEGHTGPFTWEPAVEANADGTEAVAFPTETTTYYATGPSAASCNALDSITIEVNESPPVLIAPDVLTFCPGISIPIEVSTAESYVWDSEDITESGNAPNEFILTPTIDRGSMEYTVTATFASGCEGTGTLQAEAGAGLTIGVIADKDSICLGENIEVSLSGANEYTWESDAGETIQGQVILPLQ